MGLFETHLNSLKEEIQSSQANYKKMLAEKDSAIQTLNGELEQLSEKLKRRGTAGGAFTSTQKSMTGLPTSVLKQKQSQGQQQTLKFKRPAGPTPQKAAKPSEEDLQHSSTMSSSAPSGSKQSYNQFSDKQLMYDNQMLTNELIVLNQNLSKTKAELKKQTEALKKAEKDRDLARKNAETVQAALEKLRKERD